VPSLDAHGLPPGIFALLSKVKQLHLAPRAEAKIGYTFAPQRMADHEVLICIDAETPYGALQWMYEIRGIAESAQVCNRRLAAAVMSCSDLCVPRLLFSCNCFCFPLHVF
jgi:hypothetical protein